MRITNEACEHIDAYMRGKSNRTGAIRLRVVKMGCAGISFVISECDGREDGDMIVSHNGIDVVMNERDNFYTHDLTIGFEDDGLQSRFNFVSADLDAKCGCGASFQYRENNNG